MGRPRPVGTSDLYENGGEAESIAVCDHRGWPLLSQDRRALNEGRRRGIPVFGLPELLMIFAAEGRCLPTSAWAIYASIAERHERLVAAVWPCDEKTELLSRAVVKCSPSNREPPERSLNGPRGAILQSESVEARAEREHAHHRLRIRLSARRIKSDEVFVAAA